MNRSTFLFEYIRVQNRFHSVTDLPDPQGLGFRLMCGQMDPQPRESVFGHGMVCPVFQDAQPLPNRLLVTDQPAPAQQLVSDARLLTDKADLGGKGIVAVPLSTAMRPL